MVKSNRNKLKKRKFKKRSYIKKGGAPAPNRKQIPVNLQTLGEQLINAVCHDTKSDTDLVNLLLRNGAPVDYVNTENVSALSCAVYFNKIKLVEILLSKGANVNLKSNFYYGQTPLIIASKYGTYDLVNLLLNYGADPNLLGKDNVSPLHSASDKPLTTPHYKRRTEDSGLITELLIQKGANIEHKNNKHETPLHTAIINNDINSVLVLLKQGASTIDWKIKTNFKSLNSFYHSKPLSQKAVEEQIKHKKITDLLEKKEAEQKKQIELFVREKIKAGNINKKNEYGNTKLHNSIKKKNTDLSKVLIKEGASLNVRDTKGYTPLHLAIIRNEIEIVDILIKKGVNINSKSNEKTTPLHLAAYYGREIIVEKLIQNDAILDLKDIYDMTPLEYAQEKKNSNVINLLEKNGVYLKMIKFTTLAGDYFTLNDIIPDISLFKDNNIPSSVVYSAIFSSDNKICQNITKRPFLINDLEGNLLEILNYKINQNYSIIFRDDEYRQVLIAGKPYYTCDTIGCDTQDRDLFILNSKSRQYKYLGKESTLINSLPCELFHEDCQSCVLSSKCKYKKYDRKKSRKKKKQGKCVLKSHKANNENYIFNNLEQCNR